MIVRESTRRSRRPLVAAAAAVLLATSSVQIVHAEAWVGPSGDASQGGDWNTATNWNPQTVPNAVGATAIINPVPIPGTAANTRNLTWGSAITLGSLQLNDNDTDTTVLTRTTNIGTDSASAPALTFSNGGAGANITLTGNVTTSAANVYSMLGPIVLAEQLTINANMIKGTVSGGVVTFDPTQITLNFRGTAGSNITGPGGITKNGPSTVAFADTAKSYAGPTIINEGRFRFNGAAGNAGGLSGTSSVTVNSGGQLHFDTAGTGTNNLGASAATVVTLNGNGMATSSGAIRVETGRITSMHNAVNLASNATISTNGTTSQLTLPGVVSGPGALAHNNGPAAGAGTLILTGANTYAGGTTNHAGTLRIGPGGSAGTGNVTNNATFDVFANTTLAGVSGSGNTTIGDGTNAVTVTANHFRQGTLNVKSTAVVAPSGGASTGTSKLTTLTLATGAKLDLKDNKLIAGNPAGTASGGVYNGLQGDVQRAHGDGSWNGTSGLTTSMPQATNDGLTTVAVATGAQLGVSTFGGQAVAPTDSVAFYTYGGDTNFDGMVSGDDYGTIDFSILVPGSDGYYNGDFNYDGVVNGDDYGVIDFTIIAQGAPFPTSGAAASVSGVTAVPEPSTCGLVIAAGAALLARRRRRRNA